MSVRIFLSLLFFYLLITNTAHANAITFTNNQFNQIDISELLDKEILESHLVVNLYSSHFDDIYGHAFNEEVINCDFLDNYNFNLKDIHESSYSYDNFKNIFLSYYYADGFFESLENNFTFNIKINDNQINIKPSYELHDITIKKIINQYTDINNINISEIEFHNYRVAPIYYSFRVGIRDALSAILDIEFAENGYCQNVFASFSPNEHYTISEAQWFVSYENRSPEPQEPIATPEPGTFLMLAIGLAAVCKITQSNRTTQARARDTLPM